MSYDPRVRGARCDECILKGSTVVPPETSDRVSFAIVGEAPGEDEEKYGRPFVGASGKELDASLRVAGLSRSQAHVTNVMLCRPPDNKLDRLLRRLRKEAKESESEVITPMECCAPRLELEIEGVENFIALGKTATKAVSGVGGSILALRGGLMTLDRTERTPFRRVMPTVHPAFVLRQRRWLHVFRNDLAKAGRWFRGEASWKPPEIIRNPSAEMLRDFLARKRAAGRILTYDIETDGIECLSAHIRCIAIGDAEEVMVIGFRSNTWPVSLPGIFLDWYSELGGEAILRVLKEWFEDPETYKFGWNQGYYDALVLRSQLDIYPQGQIDGIMVHRNVESELPHNLAYAASLYTEAPAWKCDREGNKIALGGESDDELAIYCATDVSVTARVLPPLIEQLSLRDQVEVWQSDQQIQFICADMHAAGMYVDQEARLEQEKKLLKTRWELLNAIREGVGNPDFNPMSVPQLRKLLFTDWHLADVVAASDLKEEDIETGSGDMSTGDLILRTLLFARGVDPKYREIIKLIRRYRKALKVLGTYVVKLRPSDMDADLGWDDDEDWIDKETRKKYGEAKKGIVVPETGRMHPGYNAAVAVTGRLSSSKPFNAQNVPKKMRAMVKAQAGHILVGADMDQLELRIAAALWQVKLYLKAFADGKDPHSMTAFAIFGQDFCKAAGLEAARFDLPGLLVGTAYDERGKFALSGGEAKDMRDLSKAVQYASQYMGAVETVHHLIQKVELPSVDPVTRKPRDDGTTDLPYAQIPLKRVREMRENWLNGAPEFKFGWEKEIGEFRRLGYLREPVGGRRRDFMDGEDPNQIVNFKIQSAAAALMNRSLIQLYQHIPLWRWGPGTGIINQCHDSLVVECPIDTAHFDPDARGGKGGWVVPTDSTPGQVVALLEECLNQTHPALPGVRFTASAGVGMTWKEVG